MCKAEWQLAGILMLILTVSPRPAFAGSEQKPCEDAATQLEMNNCAEQDANASDKALNEVYRSVLNKLGPEDKNALKSTQRGWIMYRDDDCAAETALYAGGSIAPLIRFSCLAKLTKERTAEIRRVYVHFLGD